MAVSKIERSYHCAFISKSYIHDYTIAANGAIAISAAELGLNAIVGYKIAAITGFDLGNSNSLVCRYLMPKLSGTVAVIRNIADSAATTRVAVDVLWARSDMF